jgi:hypothetical protein
MQLEATEPLAHNESPVAGRSCPVSYRYAPEVLRRTPDLHVDTLYIAGGLYGNPFALDAIESLFAAEPGKSGLSKRLVFNGDFHWFDADPALFSALDARVLAHTATRGNVETEIAQADGGADCGCAYPANVDEGTVARSNQIIERLRSAAQHNPSHCARLAALPMYLRAQVGSARVGIVHGDAQSLAGWRFDARALDEPDARPWLGEMFSRADIDLFASSHTCAPALRVFDGLGAVINNGSAGMSSVPGTAHGIVTRISIAPPPPEAPVLASACVAGVYVDAIAVRFDESGWHRQFLSLWPQGSAAHQSYWQRIVHGPSTNTLNASVDHHSGT